MLAIGLSSSCAGSSLMPNLVRSPIAGRTHTPGRLEERLTLRQIDRGQALLGLGDQELRQVVAADLLELAVGQLEAIARVHGIGQRLPVPFVGFDVAAEVLLQGLEDLRLNHPVGLVAGSALRFGKAGPDEVGRVEINAQPLGGELGKGGSTVVGIEEPLQGEVDLVADHFQDADLAIAPVQDLLAEAVNPLALVVHDLVVFEQVLADVEIAFFHLFLGGLDTARHHAAFDGLARLHAEAREDAFDPIAREDPHQVVFERQIKPAGARVTLPTGAAAELIVDAAGLVALGAEDVQAAHFGDKAAFLLHLFLGFDPLHQGLPLSFRDVQKGGVFVLEAGPGHGFGVAAEDDIGAAAGHVSGNGDGADAAGLGDDLGLVLSKLGLGVEQRVLDAAALEHGAELFRFVDVDGPDEHGPARTVDVVDLLGFHQALLVVVAEQHLQLVLGLPANATDQQGIVLELDDVVFVDVLDLFEHRVPLFLFRHVNDIGKVAAHERHVGGDGDDVEFIDLPELIGLGHGGASHARQLFVEFEVVLQSDRGESLRLFLDLYALAGMLGLDGLVQAVAPLPAVHEAAGELVDDDDGHVVGRLGVAHHDVTLVFEIKVVGLEGIVDEVRPFHVAGGVEALDAGQFFRLADPLVGQVAGVFLFLDLKVPARLLLLQIAELHGDLVGCA